MSSLSVNNFVFLHKHDLNPVYCDFKILIILRDNINTCYGCNSLYWVYFMEAGFLKNKVNIQQLFP